MENKEREYTFSVCRDGMEYVNGRGESFFKTEEYTLHESKLEDKHMDLLLGELLIEYRKYPIVVQKRFYARLMKLRKEVQA